MVFLFVGLQIITIYTRAPFLCFMVGDPANPTVRSAVESIENFINFLNCTQLQIPSSHRTYLSENMLYMVPVNALTGELHELLDGLHI